MSITLSEAAAKQVRTQLQKRGKGLGLRIGVKSVGCSGLAYTYEIADDVREGEQVFEDHGASVVVDAKGLAVVGGARVDFVSEGLKQAFKVENPNAESTCGCGESFNVKAGTA
jgi:iron-sulfur cluster assembly protein